MSCPVVEKIGPRHFIVTGVIAVVAGRIVNEPYHCVHFTRSAADRDAASLHRQNIDALNELTAATLARVAAVKAAFAGRAARGPAQSVLCF